jgi:hypothetical protein
MLIAHLNLFSVFNKRKDLLLFLQRSRFNEAFT